ncbi:unnamed protein product [Staurois parvus]|uniref:Uncharacterized protein n=1 Tax=Staurois parvus TaxID=386267 RepID=A0ABN9CC88_9NEOB|nr:unnamed protein product [Staurois parvus]
MHPPKTKQKNTLAIHTKLNMCRVSPQNMPYQEIRGGHWKKDQTTFLHNAED